jgi:hypothetical protein
MDYNDWEYNNCFYDPASFYYDEVQALYQRVTGRGTTAEIEELALTADSMRDMVRTLFQYALERGITEPADEVLRLASTGEMPQDWDPKHIRDFKSRRGRFERLVGEAPDLRTVSCSAQEERAGVHDRLYKVDVDGTTVEVLVGRWRPSDLFYEIRRGVGRKQTTRDPREILGAMRDLVGTEAPESASPRRRRS